MTDPKPVGDAETGQSVGEASSLHSLDAVADGVIEEVLAVELTGGDESDQGLEGVAWQPRMVVGGTAGWL